MNFEEILAEAPERKTSTRPAMDVWIDSLDPNDAALVLAEVRSNRLGHTELLARLVRLGAPEIKAKTFGDWRAGKGWTRA